MKVKAIIKWNNAKKIWYGFCDRAELEKALSGEQITEQITEQAAEAEKSESFFISENLKQINRDSGFVAFMMLISSTLKAATLT